MVGEKGQHIPPASAKHMVKESFSLENTEDAPHFLWLSGTLGQRFSIIWFYFPRHTKHFLKSVPWPASKGALRYPSAPCSLNAHVSASAKLLCPRSDSVTPLHIQWQLTISCLSFPLDHEHPGSPECILFPSGFPSNAWPQKMLGRFLWNEIIMNTLTK